MTAKKLPITQLHAHPLNSNAMPTELFNKLKHHLARTGNYPPIIVRPHPDESLRARGGHQILDGHHRVAALSALGHPAARCDVWEVNDEEALLLLATLNRLEGKDDPHKRADLLDALFDRAQPLADEFASLLPEGAAAMRELMSLRDPPPAPLSMTPLDEIPSAVHFFLLPPQRKQLMRVLTSIDDNREQALMSLVQRHDTTGE